MAARQAYAIASMLGLRGRRRKPRDQQATATTDAGGALSALQVISILGPPASGKGTQCSLMLERYGMVHISTGDLLRARKKFLPELAAYMDQGSLVPDEIVCSVLKERLAEGDCAIRGVLLDGFPRTRQQAEILEKLGVAVTNLILLDVPDALVIERVEGRRIDPVSGKIYHVLYNPPDNDAIAGRLIQRMDDTRAKIVRRLGGYRSNIEQILRFYGQTVTRVQFVGGSDDGGDGGAAAEAGLAAAALAAGEAGEHVRTVPLQANPMVVHDVLRTILEGARYWGSIIDSYLLVKYGECGNAGVSLLSVGRYFEHMCWRMLLNGCLSDANAAADSSVLRAQSLRVHRLLRPLQKCHVTASLTSLLVHTAKEPAPETATADNDDDNGNDDGNDGGESGGGDEADAAAVLAWSRAAVPAGAWSRDVVASSFDIDASGCVNQASFLHFCESTRMLCAAAGGYKGQGWEDLVSSAGEPSAVHMA
eukprot:g2465.t1